MYMRVPVGLDPKLVTCWSEARGASAAAEAVPNKARAEAKIEISILCLGLDGSVEGEVAKEEE